MLSKLVRISPGIFLDYSQLNPTSPEVSLWPPLASRASKFNSQKWAKCILSTPRGPLQNVVYHCSGHNFCWYALLRLAWVVIGYYIILHTKHQTFILCRCLKTKHLRNVIYLVLTRLVPLEVTLYIRISWRYLGLNAPIPISKTHNLATLGKGEGGAGIFYWWEINQESEFHLNICRNRWECPLHRV